MRTDTSVLEGRTYVLEDMLERTDPFESDTLRVASGLYLTLPYLIGLPTSSRGCVVGSVWLGGLFEISDIKGCIYRWDKVSLPFPCWFGYSSK